jgi:hypothetical protein
MQGNERRRGNGITRENESRGFLNIMSSKFKLRGEITRFVYTLISYTWVGGSQL